MTGVQTCALPIYLVSDPDNSIDEAIASYRAAITEANEAVGKERSKLVEKHLRGYVTENAEKIREGVLDGSLVIDADLLHDLEFVRRMKDGGLAELESRSALQLEIIAAYDEEHMKYIKEAEEK